MLSAKGCCTATAVTLTFNRLKYLSSKIGDDFGKDRVWVSTAKKKKSLQNIDVPMAYKIVNCSIRCR